MAGISQTVLINSEPIVGYRGQLAKSNSLAFGKDAGTTLLPGDTSKMSSLNITGLPALNNDSWTIEYWVRHTNTEFNEGIVHINGQAILASSNFVGGPALLHGSSGIELNNYLINNASFSISSNSIPSQAWQVNDWYHVAIVKNTSSYVTSWVNGYRTPVGSVFSPNNYSIPFTIIASWRNSQGLGVTNNLIGSLYNLSITNNQEVYDVNDATITVPTMSQTSTPAMSLLLLAQRSQTFTNNSSGGAVISTRAGITSSSTNTPFNDSITAYTLRRSPSSPFMLNGSGSYYFYGRTSSYGTYDGTGRTAYGTDDFTIEWFSYAQNENRINPGIYWHETSGVCDLGISFYDDGTDINVLVRNGSNSVTVGSLSRGLYYKQWLHWAVVRYGGTVYAYCNGSILDPVGQTFGYNISSSSGTLYVGKKGAAAVQDECFYGYLTNLRAVKGLAVYLGNYAVPTHNLQRFQFDNPYGGLNTYEIRTDQTAILMVP